MAQIFKAQKKARGNGQRQVKTVSAKINTVDHLGQGVCHQQPVIFAQGGLPGEECQIAVVEQKKRFWRGYVTRVTSPNTARVLPFCEYFGRCGGCQTQHVQQQAMLDFKQQAVSELCMRATGAKELNWQPALFGHHQGYRRKTRIAVDARTKGKPLVGFRAKDSKRVVPIETCPILSDTLSDLLQPIQRLFHKLENPGGIGHISMLSTGDGTQVCFRVLKTPSRNDRILFSAFAESSGCQVVFEAQDGDLDFINGSPGRLTYSPETDLNLEIGINDFLQINDHINQQMIQQAANWLALNEQDTLLDLFCGVGNFSLSLARRCKSVIGIEGMSKMVQRARHNAQINGIENCEFRVADLSQSDSLRSETILASKKILLDPARDGALNTLPQIARIKPSHILYVSCNPATFVRDAAELTQENYRLEKIGLMDMFPNTSHTELMALFVRQSD